MLTDSVSKKAEELEDMIFGFQKEMAGSNYSATEQADIPGTEHEFYYESTDTDLAGDKNYGKANRLMYSINYNRNEGFLGITINTIEKEKQKNSAWYNTGTGMKHIIEFNGHRFLQICVYNCEKKRKRLFKKLETPHIKITDYRINEDYEMSAEEFLTKYASMVSDKTNERQIKEAELIKFALSNLKSVLYKNLGNSLISIETLPLNKEEEK